MEYQTVLLAEICTDLCTGTRVPGAWRNTIIDNNINFLYYSEKIIRTQA